MNKKLTNHHTIVTKVGRNADFCDGAVNIPVHHASTILFSNIKDLQHSKNHIFESLHYGRLGNPTSWSFEEAIAEIEGGYKGVLGPSGLSIITAVLMAYIKAGSHILIPNNVYGGVHRFCEEVLKKFDVTIEYYSSNIGEKISNLFRLNTSLVYVESPGSFDLAVTDLPSIVEAAKVLNIPVIVDNTWATSIYYKPIQMGADVSIQSATKYIVGHSDAILGIAVCTEKSWPIIKNMSYYLGICAGPDDVYLALRGLRTLAVRMDRHQKSALKIAKWLQVQPEVEKVFYPALKDDPGYQIWKRDYKGASGRFAIKLKKISIESLASMLDNMKHFSMGFSWGGFESTIMPDLPDEMASSQDKNIILRISIGLEDPNELIDDLKKGFIRLNLL